MIKFDFEKFLTILFYLAIPICLFISIGNNFLYFPSSIYDFFALILLHFQLYIISLGFLFFLTTFICVIIYILQLIWKDMKGKIKWNENEKKKI